MKFYTLPSTLFSLLGKCWGVFCDGVLEPEKINCVFQEDVVDVTPFLPLLDALNPCAVVFVVPPPHPFCRSVCGQHAAVWSSWGVVLFSIWRRLNASSLFIPPSPPTHLQTWVEVPSLIFIVSFPHLNFNFSLIRVLVLTHEAKGSILLPLRTKIKTFTRQQLRDKQQESWGGGGGRNNVPVTVVSSARLTWTVSYTAPMILHFICVHN